MERSATDLGIDVAGFFVVRTASNSVSELQFTRDGSFLPDASGYLRNDAGLYLQGWRLDSAGNSVEGSGTADLGPVRIRPEERRVGKECVSPCRSRWSTYKSKKNNHMIVQHHSEID